MKLVIPKKEVLIKTNNEDVLELYYNPFFKYIFRKRLRMCTSLLDGHKFNNLLELGYGTGIFFFTLSKISKKIYGLDRHKKHKEIMEKYGLNLKLTTGDISNLPYKNNFFDAIICISTLEHIKHKDLDKVLNEFYRVLEEDNYLFLGIPVKNKITDIFFNSMTFLFKEQLGDILEEHHISSHKDIIKAVEKKFKIIKIIKLPNFLPIDFTSYICLKAKKI